MQGSVCLYHFAEACFLSVIYLFSLYIIIVYNGYRGMFAYSSIYTPIHYLFNMTYVAARLLGNILVNSNKEEWITFTSIYVPFHQRDLSSSLIL